MGTQELLTLFALALLFFGAKRLPELADSLGHSIHRFRHALAEAERPTNGSDSTGVNPPGSNLQ